MGLNQSNPQPVKKTEEQIREDMKKKWENFGATQSSQINEQKEENEQNPESINNNNENTSQSNDEKKEEEEKKEKKTVFLSLKPRTEEQNEENNDKIVNNNDNNNEKLNNILSYASNINKNENISSNENTEKNNNEKEETQPTNDLEDNTTNEKEQNINDNETNNEDITKNQDEPKPVKKDIDLENVTIEKVFHISLSEDNPKKFLYLELYLAKLLSAGQSLSFKLENLDDIILTVINEPVIKKDLLNYLLDCFHRAYEIIEVRYKDTLGPDFAQIHLAIATYFGLLKVLI